MRYTLSLIFALLLAGCQATVPVKMEFPSVPESLKEDAPPLTQLQKQNPKLSDIIQNDNENAGKYYTLREKLRAWQEWYDSQKKIFDEVK